MNSTMEKYLLLKVSLHADSACELFFLLITGSYQFSRETKEKKMKQLSSIALYHAMNFPSYGLERNH